MAFVEEAEKALRGLRSGGPIPGGLPEVTELNGAEARQAVRSATGAPPTPATAAGGSAEAQAFRTAQAANIGPPQAGAQIEGIGTRAVNATRPLVNGAAEFGAGARSFVNGVAGKAVGAIATGQSVMDSMAPDSTDRYAARFGVEKPTGDGSVGDIAKFAALRAGGFASDLGNNLTGGLAGKLYADQPGSARAAPSVLPQPTATTALAPTTQPVAAAAAAPAAAPNVVTRVGNSFSGAGVRDGFTYAGDGPPKGATGQGGVAPGYDNSHDAAYAEAMRGKISAQQELDAFGPGPHGGGAGSFNGASASGGLRDAIMSGKLTRSQMNALLTDQSNQTSLRGQDIQAQTNAAQLANSRYHTDIGAAVSTRGQDSTARTAANAARLEQMQKDRTYTLDVAKFGHEQAAQNFTQRESADKNLTTQIEAMNPGADGKPDANRVAADKTGIMRSVARMGLDGAHQLSPLDTQRLLTANQLLGTMRENGSNFLPWKPDLLKTIDPVDLTKLRTLPNGDRQITRADSKAAGQIIPKRFFDTEEGVRFFGGTPTNRYDILHEGTK